MIEAITRGVNEVAANARVLVAPSEPIVGASLLGLDALHADAGATTRARAELDAALAEIGYDPAVTVGGLPERSFGSAPSVTSE